MVSTLARRSQFVRDVMANSTSPDPFIVKPWFLKEALVSVARTYWWTGLAVGLGIGASVIYGCVKYYNAHKDEEE